MIFAHNSLPSSKLSSYLLRPNRRTFWVPRRFSEASNSQREDALRLAYLIAHETKLADSDSDSDSDSTHFQLIRHLFRPPLEPKSTKNDINVLQFENIDAIDLSLALTSCGSARDFRVGGCYHCAAIARGFVANVYVGTCLVNFYAKCGELKSARQVFDEMPVRNVVSWTAIIAGFAHKWRVDICLELFRRMRVSDSAPNGFTFAALLGACSGAGALAQGRSVHSLAIRTGSRRRDVLVSNSLVSMYSKCGDLGDATRVFRAIGDDKDTVSWNSMISGYALHGLASRAIALFEEMKRGDARPDPVTYLAVLSSCRHAGLVREGRLYLESMAEHGVDPGVDHYSCVVDLLGRAGLLEEARRVIAEMPVAPNSVIWSSMLSSSRLHGNVGFGVEAAENKLVLEPRCAATLLQLANLYAGAGRWGCAAKVRKLMRERGVKISTGYSWIEIKNVVHKFKAEDKSNTRMVNVALVLDILVDHMTSLDYDVEVHEPQFYV